MLSKQQKLKYGQLLRQQMKEKEQRKKFQSIQKRGGAMGRQIQNIQVNQPPIRQQMSYNNPQIFQKQNSYQQQQRQYIDPKEELQKKLESQDYSYFGAPGGGAPNKKGQQQQQYAQYAQSNQYGNKNNMSQPTGLRMPVQEMYTQPQNMQYNPMQGQRVRTMSQQPSYYPPQNNQYNNLAQQSISPQSGYNRPQQQPQYYQDPMMGGRVSSNPYLQPTTQQNYPQSNYPPNNYRQQPRQPISYEYIQQKPSRVQQPQYQYQPPSPYQMGGKQPYQPPQLQPNNSLVREELQLQNYPPQQMQMHSNLDRQNQQLQQVYRKGGRNLLKLQNQTVDEHLIKQKRKMEIQKQLKQQIQEGQRKKKQEKQRLKRQEEQQEKKHLAYLAEQKRKLDQEERKKKEQKQKMIDDNVRNLQQKKKMQQQAKKKAQQDQQNRTDKEKRQRQAQLNKEQQEKLAQQRKNQPPQQQFSSNQNTSRNNKQTQRISEDDSISVVSSDTSQLQKDFNTALSKQFFRKQRERNNPSFSNNQNQKLQKVTSQIHKMSNQINQQREMFDRELNRVKQEAQRAQIQKRRAEDQNQKLKNQLKRKFDEDNQKLFRALQGNNDSRNDFTKLPQQHYGRNLNQYQVRDREEEQDYPTFNKKKPLRQKQSQNLVQRDYQPQQKPMKYQPRQEDLNQFDQSNVGLVSLDGDSKKIPLFLQHGDKLTMSQVQNFAKDSAFFQKGGLGFNSSPKNNQKPYNRIQQSIVEQVQDDREYGNNNSRKSNRGGKKQSSLYKNNKDQLDKMLQSRAKSRGGWGEMSSVNSDITKQIQELLRKKDNVPVTGGNAGRNGRPNSISNAAKQSLVSNNGYAYDGMTLNSNVGNNGIGTLGTNGTIDIERINGRNDARLRELRNLGVQTVNTNGDDDLNQLDQLLNKYK